MPVRVQLRRTKGWRMPENTVSVARPGRWGNPYWISKWRDRDMCIALFRDTAQGIWNPTTGASMPDAWFNGSYEAHCGWLKKLRHHPIEVARAELRGKNLACWCPLDQPCHADVLLELANS